MTDCYLCGVALSGAIEQDHVIPIRAAGPDHPSNTRPTHASCNRQKHASLPVPEAGENYILPLRSRSERRESSWKYRDLAWHTEQTRKLKKGRLNSWLTWPDTNRLRWFIGRRGVLVNRDRWKREKLNSTRKMLVLLETHGISELAARQYVWSAQNSVGRVFYDWRL